MNKYSKLFNEIYQMTTSGKIIWKQISRSANSAIIFNPNIVFRQYSAKMEKFGKVFQILLLEKKIEDPSYDYVVEKYSIEIIVLDHDGELLFEMTPALIDKEELEKLVLYVQANNDRTRELFE